MKKANVCIAVLALVAGIFASSCDSKKSVKLNNGLDSASYSLGILNGDGFRKNITTVPGGSVNIDLLLAGFEEALRDENAKTKLTMEEANAFVQEYFTRVQAEEANKTKEEGDKFLEENKAKPGVITTESGLQYQVITEGTGERPTATDRVKVHYTGTLLDGKVFDSTADRGEPAEFGVGQVIRGWTEGLQIMPVGSKYIFWIPADLAYGERGAGQDIKANATLKFEVELLEILK
ncbi:FKBP-type peptidyl-prolyl cis-trans isomerase [Parabacteroides sp. PF5-6]|uniref:FKBP-type peptidyl-prolyl cis-trans isomerase n=1 Tax=Parabacteroides sp. PF5-6 TaxID=1742403 RepID=UPI0024059420|nr:FKBP-type peptidyl-prolyl cis-trans isomerase [Parabacteroides sp. PF5-6]MDF9829884.1 FKBP-type peptidyl-prolyl cis-trans isomerase [Parabacteroides sp. PF5-6]